MKPTDITRKRHRTVEQVKRDHAWVKSHVQEIREAFGEPVGLRIFERGDLVYAWGGRADDRPRKVTPRNRVPHRWTDRMKNGMA